MSVSFNATTFPVGRNSNSVAVADFNKDGFVDIVTGGTVLNSSFPFGSSTGGLSTLLGNGTGGFGTAISSSGTQFGAANSIATGDFNLDGNLDVITTGSIFGVTSNDVFVALGDGTGKFTAGTSLIVGSSPQSIVTGDVNGDGFVDAVTANSGGNTLSILIGDGKGGLSSKNVVVTGNPGAVALRDFNGDGRLDIAAVTTTGSYGDRTADLSLLLGDGKGNFATSNPISLGDIGSGGSDLTVADFNGDGRADIAAVSGGKIKVLLADPVRTFIPVFETEQFTASITSGDFNGDGRIDLATTSSNYTNTNATVFLGNGSGSFSRPVSFAASGSNFFSASSDAIAAADFNRDGKTDLTAVVPNFTDASVLINNTTETDAIAQGTTNGINFIDASSELSGPVEIDLGKGTFVLKSTPRVTRSLQGVDEAIGTVRDDVIAGNRNQNLLNGFSGNDELNGGLNNDRLVGGAGKDELTGGKGKDRFIFSATPNYPEGLEIPYRKPLLGTDRITDFEVGKDKIVLDAGTFTKLTAGKKVSFDTVDDLSEARSSKGIITYVRGNGKLYYNPNGGGSGFGNGGIFAILEDAPKLGAKDFSAFL